MPSKKFPNKLHNDEFLQLVVADTAVHPHHAPFHTAHTAHDYLSQRHEGSLMIPLLVILPSSYHIIANYDHELLLLFVF